MINQSFKRKLKKIKKMKQNIFVLVLNTLHIQPLKFQFIFILVYIPWVLKRIIFKKFNVNTKHATGIWRTIWTLNHRIPFEQIVRVST